MTSKYNDILTPCEFYMRCYDNAPEGVLIKTTGYKFTFCNREIGVHIKESVLGDEWTATDIATGLRIVPRAFKRSGNLIKHLFNREDWYKERFEALGEKLKEHETTFNRLMEGQSGAKGGEAV